MILGLWYHTIFATLFAMVAILLMLVILLQRGKGVGLSGAFGGAGGHTALGAKTGDILTWVTMVGAGVFILLAIGLNFMFRPSAPTLVIPSVGPPGASTPAPAPAPAPASTTLPPPVVPIDSAAPPAGAATPITPDGSPADANKPADNTGGQTPQKPAEPAPEKPADGANPATP